jgi:hypothetical protein
MAHRNLGSSPAEPLKNKNRLKGGFIYWAQRDFPAFANIVLAYYGPLRSLSPTSYGLILACTRRSLQFKSFWEPSNKKTALKAVFFIGPRGT